MWIDSHCHLNHRNLAKAGTLDEVLTRANDNSIDGMLTVNCNITNEFAEILEISREHKNIWCSVGTHPHDASVPEEMAITQEKLVELALSDTDNVIAIGETGLDYYYDNADRDDQDISLRKHLKACVETDLPAIIHSRDADEDMIRILREESDGGKLRGVLHCFSSGAELAKAAIEIGFYISLSGIITFKNSQELRDIAKDVPLDRLLVETDTPYLAPVPYRGKTNEPAYVADTGACLAEIHGISIEEMAAQTTDNFFTLFNKAKRL